MKLKNISDVEQKVMPHTGPSFSCAAGAVTGELADVCGEELLRDFPSVWEAADVKHTKSKKAGGK